MGVVNASGSECAFLGKYTVSHRLRLQGCMGRHSANGGLALAMGLQIASPAPPPHVRATQVLMSFKHGVRCASRRTHAIM